MDKSEILMKSVEVEPKSTSATLIVVGDREPQISKSVEYYNPNSDLWTKVLDLKIDRTEFKCIMYEKKLMILLGRENSVRVQTVQSYDFATGELETLTPMSTPKINVGAVVISRHLFVIGGWDSDYVDTVHRYDFTSKVWTEDTHLNVARENCESVVFNGEIYAIGGNNGEISSVTEAYNPITKDWRYCAPMNTKRNNHSVATLGKYIYAFGGLGSSNNTLNTGERYDPSIDRWTYIQTLNVPRNLTRAEVHQGVIVVAGGYNVVSNQVDSRIDVYDPEKDLWIERRQLATPRRNFNLLEVPWKF